MIEENFINSNGKISETVNAVELKRNLEHERDTQLKLEEGKRNGYEFSTQKEVLFDWWCTAKVVEKDFNKLG